MIVCAAGAGAVRALVGAGHVQGEGVCAHDESKTARKTTPGGECYQLLEGSPFGTMGGWGWFECTQPNTPAVCDPHCSSDTRDLCGRALEWKGRQGARVATLNSSISHYVHCSN